MKFLLEIFEKSKPLFDKGGKLEKLYPLYEAKESFLFTPSDITTKGAHVRDQIDMKRMMISVVVAMIPCILFGIYNAGNQHLLVNSGQGYFPFINGLPFILPEIVQGALLVMPIIVVSYAVGGIWEVVFAVVRKHEINEGFLVSGMLYAMILPPTIPLWQVAIGISFGVVFGKEVFGGTGMNFLNPALTARAFVFFAYPKSMSGDAVWTSVVKEDISILQCKIVSASEMIVQGFTGQTPLAALADDSVPLGSTPTEAYNIAMNVLQQTPFEAQAHGANFSFWNMFIGNIGGSIGETSTLACLLGAIFLLITGIASWRIMLSMVIGLLGSACIVKLGMTAMSPAEGFSQGEGIRAFYMIPAYYHLVMGGFAFGCVFMATDPVSAATTNTGKWIYGLIIGVIIYIVRLMNPAYPEGVMLAILFGNMVAPYIDHFVVKANIKRRMSRGHK